MKEESGRQRRGRGASGSIMDIFSLGRMLLMSPDPSVRASSARRMALTGQRSAYAFLRRALRDRDDEVIVAAVKAIGALGVRQSAADMLSLFVKGSQEVRMEIVSTAAVLGFPPEFDKIITLALHDADPEIRERAAALYGRHAP